MSMSRYLSAAALAVLVSTPVWALEATKQIAVDATPAQAWAAIGEFCAIGDWHPAVEKCELSEKDGKVLRTLSLKGGGTIVDVLIGERVRWLDAPEPLWAALFSAVVVFEAVRFGAPPEKSLVWADAAGLALFTATGTQRLIALGLDPAVTIFLTALGATGGGNRVAVPFSG